VAAGNPARIPGTMDEFISRKRQELDCYPRFGIEYTTGKDITDEMKSEMIAKMVDRHGYVVQGHAAAPFLTPGSRRPIRWPLY
jgi:hypothetical protein